MLAFCFSLVTFLTVGYFLALLGKQYVSREMLAEQSVTLPETPPMVSIIIPARNEETSIEKCIRSLMHQSYSRELYEIIVIDDGSTDTTPDILKQLQSEDSGIIVINARELPDGWTGKNNACYCGVQKARGQMVCFIDADTVAEPELITTTVSYALEKEIDLLSINPFQQLVTLEERMMLPGIFLGIASRMDFERSNDPAKKDAIANGQFLLFNRNTYDELGGHAAMNNTIMEDLAFARLIKESGKLLYWGFGDGLMSTRMYKNSKEIWQGFSKNLSEIIRVKNLTGAVMTLIKGFVLGWAPIAMTITSIYMLQHNQTLSVLSFFLSSTALLSMTIFGIISIRAFQISMKYVLALPVGFSLYGILALNSFLKKRSGNRQWKGRTCA